MMEKPIKKSFRKTQQPDPYDPSFLIIYTLLPIIIGVWIAIYYNKLKHPFGYLLKNIKLSKHNI